jgi:hypothetical protein
MNLQIPFHRQADSKRIPPSDCPISASNLIVIRQKHMALWPKIETILFSGSNPEAAFFIAEVAE